MSEKVSQVKLSNRGATNIGRFESLESLVRGIHGRLALWRAIAAIAENDMRFQATEFRSTAARVETQEAQVERRRWRREQL